MFDLNQYLLDPRNLKAEFNTAQAIAAGMRQVDTIRCKDGLEFSAQASQFHYCTPRDSTGPWTAVEIGFPNQRVDAFIDFAEMPDDPTDTVYGQVPTALVEAVVEQHGGLAVKCTRFKA